MALLVVLTWTSASGALMLLLIALNPPEVFFPYIFAIGAPPFLCLMTVSLLGEPRILLPPSRRGASLLHMIAAFVRAERGVLPEARLTRAQT